MKKLLSGNDPKLSTLRLQLKTATVADRKNTGSGFYVDFLVPPNVPRISANPSFEIGDVAGKLNDGKLDVGFVLFVKDGALSMLEGFAYGTDEWPEQIADFQLHYTKGEREEAATTPKTP
jgi:hypothetical protein